MRNAEDAADTPEARLAVVRSNVRRIPGGGARNPVKPLGEQLDEPGTEEGHDDGGYDDEPERPQEQSAEGGRHAPEATGRVIAALRDTWPT